MFGKFASKIGKNGNVCSSNAVSIPAFRVSVFLFCFFLAVTTTQAEGLNLMRNGGFEHDLAPWGWEVSGQANAAGQLDNVEKHSGQRSFKITNASEKGTHVFGRVLQVVEGLKPLTTYEISVWCNGKNVDKKRSF